MKTILIVIGGMADIPDRELGGKTPMMVADMPSLKALSEGGMTGLYLPVEKGFPVSVQTTLLSMFGYDLRKGIPSSDDLISLALEEKPQAHVSMKTNGLIIPFFSGHGVTITSSLVARGIGKLSFLEPTDLYTIGSEEREIANTIAAETISKIGSNEFVFVYIDSPYKAAKAGEPELKQESLEIIDSHILSPVADFVWHAKEQMNLAITSGFISSWRTRSIMAGKVPAVIYFNDDIRYHKGVFNELEICKEELNFKKPYDLMRFLSLFMPPEPQLQF